MAINLEHGAFAEFKIITHCLKSFHELWQEATRDLLLLPLDAEMVEHEANGVSTATDGEVMQDRLLVHLRFSDIFITYPRPLDQIKPIPHSFNLKIFKKIT